MYKTIKLFFFAMFFICSNQLLAGIQIKFFNNDHEHDLNLGVVTATPYYQHIVDALQSKWIERSAQLPLNDNEYVRVPSITSITFSAVYTRDMHSYPVPFNIRVINNQPEFYSNKGITGKFEHRGDNYYNFYISVDHNP